MAEAQFSDWIRDETDLALAGCDVAADWTLQLHHGCCAMLETQATLKVRHSESQQIKVDYKQCFPPQTSDACGGPFALE
jgi:hypothetical protein